MMDMELAMDSGTLRGIATALALIAFLAVTIWAWSRKRHATFEAAARMPLEEDAHDRPQARGGERC